MMAQLDGFELLFSEHFPAIVRFAERRLSNRSAAEDIAAETFAAAWDFHRRGATIKRAWLYQVASNKLADYYRSDERRSELIATLARDFEGADTDMLPLDRLAVREALLKLRDRDRETVVLTYWHGMSASEVAEVQGGSASLVWKVLSRSRAQLRAHLAGESQGVKDSLERQSRPPRSLPLFYRPLTSTLDGQRLLGHVPILPR